MTFAWIKDPLLALVNAQIKRGLNRVLKKKGYLVENASVKFSDKFVDVDVIFHASNKELPLEIGNGWTIIDFQGKKHLHLHHEKKTIGKDTLFTDQMLTLKQYASELPVYGGAVHEALMERAGGKVQVI